MNHPPQSLAAQSIERQAQTPDGFSAKALVSDILVLCIQLSLVFAFFLTAIRSGTADFREMYSSAYMVRTGHGHEIYDDGAQKKYQNGLVSVYNTAIPSIRFPFQALFYVPFSILPYHQAFFAFLAFNLLALFLCIQLLRSYMSRLTRICYYLPALIFLFFPITVALMQGQDSIILLALLTGGFLCLEQDREYLAGVLVAVGLIKFQLVIPVFLLFLAWRRWRFSAAFAGTSIVLAGISIWITGTAQALRYFQLMIGIGSSLRFESASPIKMELMANLHGALYAMLASSPVVILLTIAASAAIMIWASSKRPQGSNALLIAIPVGVLVSYYMYVHDLSILILPLAVMLNHLAGDGKTKFRFRRIQLVVAVLLLVTPTCLIFAQHYFWIASLPLLAFAIFTTISLSPSQNAHRMNL